MLDFAGKRWYYLSVSIVLFIVAAVILAIPPHLKTGIEFSSGSSFTELFSQPVDQGDLRTAMKDLGYADARIQSLGNNTFLIRTPELPGTPALSGQQGPAPQGEIDRIEAALGERFGGKPQRQDFSTVSGTVSSEIARNATYAVIAASVAILLYVWFAFRHLAKPFRYGLCAIIALLHDAFIILGLFSFLGKAFNTEVDTAFITALLTVIGFSVHDTIVVFDRIRENLRLNPGEALNPVINFSIMQTMTRSVITSLTVVFTLLALFLFGGFSMRNFALALLVGIVSGTYSSIFNASQIVSLWQEIEDRLRHRTTAAA